MTRLREVSLSAISHDSNWRSKVPTASGKNILSTSSLFFFDTHFLSTQWYICTIRRWMRTCVRIHKIYTHVHSLSHTYQVMLCYVLLCCVTLCYVLYYYVMLYCCVVLCSVMLRNDMLCCVVLCNVLCYVVLLREGS